MPRFSADTPPDGNNPAVPLPVSLTLYNLHVPNKEPSNNNKKNKLFRPEYTADLLVPVRLDVVFSSERNNNTTSIIIADDDGNNNQAHDDDDDIMLYSSTHNRGAIHPSWDHLDECIKALKDDISDGAPAARESIYQSIKCKILAITPNKNGDQVLLADIPLHPSRLRRLPQDDNNTNPKEAAVSTWEQQPPPKQLPPNAVFLNFSDGSTRVYPQLYHLLVERNVISEGDPRDVSLIQDEEEEYKRRLRFDDDVFDTLDQAVLWCNDNDIPHERKLSPLSLLETDDESKAVVVKSIGKSGTAISEEFGTPLSLDGTGDSKELESKMAEPKLAQPGSFLPIELDSIVADLRREKEELEMLLAEEEVCLQMELAALHENESNLKKLVEKVQKVEEEIKMIPDDTVATRCKQKELDFCLEAQRIKLIEELQMIYPIRCQAEETWFIRGQEIPTELHSGAVSEDEISAALGFLCHSIVMISKYLSIPLRYRIVCNSSRSAVQEDATTILPLFQARAVDRDELDRAMTLIDRNVACILKTRGIRYSEDSHILCKVNRIYDSIINGR